MEKRVGALGTGPREEGHTPGGCFGGARGGKVVVLSELVNPWGASRWMMWFRNLVSVAQGGFVVVEMW